MTFVGSIAHTLFFPISKSAGAPVTHAVSWGLCLTLSEVTDLRAIRARILSKIFSALYAIEKEIYGRLRDERRAIRNERSRPLLESLKQWLDEILGRLSKKSDTAVAVRYALGRWEALMR